MSLKLNNSMEKVSFSGERKRNSFVRVSDDLKETLCIDCSYDTDKYLAPKTGIDFVRNNEPIKAKILGMNPYYEEAYVVQEQASKKKYTITKETLKKYALSTNLSKEKLLSEFSDRILSLKNPIVQQNYSEEQLRTMILNHITEDDYSLLARFVADPSYFEKVVYLLGGSEAASKILDAIVKQNICPLSKLKEKFGSHVDISRYHRKKNTDTESDDINKFEKPDISRIIGELGLEKFDLLSANSVPCSAENCSYIYLLRKDPDFSPKMVYALIEKIKGMTEDYISIGVGNNDTKKRWTKEFLLKRANELLEQTTSQQSGESYESKTKEKKPSIVSVSPQLKKGKIPVFPS